MNAASAAPVDSHAAPHSQRATGLLVVGAIGVVFGDIGTSPLYALKEAFSPHYGIPLSRDNVLGILSLIVWSMTWVITIKYLFVMMRADNNGEGGILALLALALREARTRPQLKWTIISIGVFGAAMFYGDSMITPSVTILSAIEGLKLASPRFTPYVIPITLAVVAVLFFIQSHGTAKVGALFGPVMVLWFLSLAALGLNHVIDNPDVLAALSPGYALDFIVTHSGGAFFVLGAVFLTLTGGEALYADMGHFGKKPIRIAWLGLVFPSLILNYFGQAAYVLADPSAIENPFYRMGPGPLLLPMIGLSTAAAIIASQAVVTGAFSMTRQAIQLGYIPRLEILHTSERAIGQIYMPFINWMLC